MASQSTFNKARVQSGISDTKESWGLSEATNTVEKIKKVPAEGYNGSFWTQRHFKIQFKGWYIKKIVWFYHLGFDVVLLKTLKSLFKIQNS